MNLITSKHSHFSMRTWGGGLSAALLIALAGCGGGGSGSSLPNTFTPGTYIGETEAVGNGAVRTFVSIGSDGKPKSFGAVFSESSLPGTSNPEEEGHVLAMPALTTAVLPFDHMFLIDNNPGHNPVGHYDKPHFDIHFYMIPTAERETIKANSDDVLPSASYIPQGYLRAPGSTAEEEGTHWIDPTSPEFNNEPYTKSLVYGFYKGKMIFMEPLLNKAYIQTKPVFSDVVLQPNKFQKSGYYPTRYSGSYNAATKEYTVSLDDLVYHNSG